MKKFAKIINGKLVWYEQPNNIVGDCTTFALKEGFKEVEEIYGNEDKIEELENKIVITKKIPIKKPELLILKTNSFLKNKTREEIESIDIDLLQGLHKESKYSKGYLYQKNYYLDNDKKVLCVKRTYELVYENNFLIGEKNEIFWYDEKGDVSLQKSFVVNFSAKEAAFKKSQIRQIQIDYLQHPEKPYQIPAIISAINKLFEHYKNVIIDYRLSGSNSFKEAIENETDSSILTILNTKLPDKKTVKESILYQIS